MTRANLPPSPEDGAKHLARTENLERLFKPPPANPNALPVTRASSDPSTMFAAYWTPSIDSSGYLFFNSPAGVNLGDIGTVTGTGFLSPAGYTLDVITAGVYAINFALEFKRIGAGDQATCEFTILPAIGGNEVDQIQRHSFDSVNDVHTFSFGWTGYLTPMSDAIYVATEDDTDWELHDAGFSVTISRIC